MAANKTPPKGRPKGVQNKVTATVKDNMLAVFNRIGGTASMAEWAKENRTEFYRLYSKLLPLQVTGEDGGPIETVSRIELVPLEK
jgi:hypothetical protein